MDDLAQVVDLLAQFGQWAVFLWLFLRELRAHEQTRREHLADLREIAGMRANLSQTRQTAKSEG